MLEEVDEFLSDCSYLQWVVEWEEDGCTLFEVVTLRLPAVLPINEELASVAIAKWFCSSLFRLQDTSMLSSDLERLQNAGVSRAVFSDYTVARLVEFGRFLRSSTRTLGQLAVFERFLCAGVEDCLLMLDPIEVKLQKSGSNDERDSSEVHLVSEVPEGVIMIRDYGSTVQLSLPSAFRSKGQLVSAVVAVLLKHWRRDFVHVQYSTLPEVRCHPRFSIE